MQGNRPDFIEPLRAPLAALGLALVIIGAFLLIYIGYLVYQIINNPEEIRIVEFLLAQVRIEEKVLFGVAADQAFEVSWSESLRTVMFLFIGVMVIGVLASILKTLISAGIQILRLAVGQSESGKQPNAKSYQGDAVDRGR